MEENKTEVMSRDEMLQKIEEIVKNLLQEQYSKGLAVGGKTFVTLIYKTITDAEKSGTKDAKSILEEVKDSCKALFNANEKYLDSESTQTIDEVVEIMKEGE